jgi:ABC-2 type transport system ATP-binding protein
VVSGVGRQIETPPVATPRTPPDGLPERGAAIAVSGLVKRYRQGNANAIDGLTFTVRPGEIFALLGPNGAGKTTTIGVLTTLVKPTAGTARVAGADVVADPIGVRARIATVPQHVNLDRALTIRENLVFHAAYHGAGLREARRRADELLARFELADRAGERPNWLSGGQTQRVVIARALMHRPAVLFCDEPTRGLDPAARNFLWEQIQKIRNDNTAILLTTHDMHEAAALADRVAIMDAGSLLAEGRPSELIRAMPGDHALNAVIELPSTMTEDDIAQRLGSVPSVDHVALLPDPGPPGGDALGDQATRVSVRLYLTGKSGALVTPVVRALEEQGMAICEISTSRPSLEDVFLHHTGRSLR